MRHLASPHLTLSLGMCLPWGRAHTSRVVFAPLPNTRPLGEGADRCSRGGCAPPMLNMSPALRADCKVPSGTTENSPRFQPWVTVEKGQSPGGAKENVDGTTWLCRP